MESKIIEMDEEEKKLPAISSSDPSERKLARRLRIKRRLENAERLKQIAEKSYVEPEKEKPLIDETIETCDDTLRQLYLEGKELVTNIRVASDSIEVSRRQTEEDEKNLRLQQLRDESASALEKLNEISAKWELIVETSSPIELHQHLKDQKARCLELISQKNDLIKSFQLELKIADEKFMKGRKTMYEELALLTKRIDEQVLIMKRACRIELEHIQESIDITRSQLMEKHSKIWSSYYNQREKDEVTNVHKKFEMVENFHRELYNLHKDHEEKFRATRINLETDIQTLEQELERVKALCLLNSEKLDYNYQVLKKREEENVYIKNHQKRRINKLQDIVNDLKKKIDEKKQSADEEMKRLAKEVERYHSNVLETEKKADQMSLINENKFHSIWNMKDEEAKDLLDKILAVDKVIHEQILGLTWTPPSTTPIDKHDLPSFKECEGVYKILKRKQQEKKDLKTSEEGKQHSLEISAGEKRLMRHIMELIADQSGFLMEEKLDELLQPYTEDEKIFVRLENVFAAIDIRTENDIETMKKFFLPFAHCSICDKKNISIVNIEVKDTNEPFKPLRDNRQSSILQMRELEEKVSKLRIQAKTEEWQADEMNNKDHASHGSDQPEDNVSRIVDTSQHSQTRSLASVKSEHQNCNLSHPLVIEKIYVLSALRNFVSEFHQHKCGILMGMSNRLAKKRCTTSRLMSKDDIIAFWGSYKSALPDRVENIWNAVYIALTRYLDILQERHKINLKAHNIRRQNVELKRLLAHYKVNKFTHNFFTLPSISSVPDEPISPKELEQIVGKLAF